ncbi:branched-chain amino acid ABC transporter substrate-binding protein [Solimonas sp. K1W22B-7]|uniref:branched-chain amino acid ABC transporter substrate-binding protein n=1 Tax=Solimonas sp. K1W22B-7 TaxID=2303331 RepID=UPI000E32F797|nr:branched-chain amino acid ABC transporter substrate-binding protein [Solimonas sp. K1W22B-7]AXQ28829.1 branched-chain amino acid ABC transporter substrate-binding protein [Solimonas sp. K1W22B-7]
MKKLLPLAVLAAALAVSGCGKKEGATASGAAPKAADGALVVKVGHASPLTGPQAHLGKDNENGVRLAIDELNGKGFEIGGKKVHFELLSEDDQADPRVATTVAKKFVDDQVNVIIGHLNSGTTIPASRIYNDAGIVEVSPSATNPKYTQQGYAGAFRVMANDVQQGKVLGEFAVKDMGSKKIAIIDDRSAYGQGLADEFEKAVKAAGGNVVVREFTNDKASDFTAILTKIKGVGPDLLFYGGMDGQGAPMTRQMKTLGLTARFLGGDGVHTAEFLKLAGAAAEGATASLPGVPLEAMPKGPEFKQRFESKYGTIQLYAPYCYDAVMVIAEAMKRAGSVESAKFLPEMGKTLHDGVTARIAFDARGDLTGGAITVYRVEGGDWKMVKTIGSAPDAAAPAP